MTDAALAAPGSPAPAIDPATPAPGCCARWRALRRPQPRHGRDRHVRAAGGVGRADLQRAVAPLLQGVDRLAGRGRGVLPGRRVLPLGRLRAVAARPHRHRGGRERARRACSRLRVAVVDVISLLFCVFFAWKSATLLHEAWVDGQTSSSSWAPPLWIPYGLLTTGMALLCAQLVVCVGASVNRAVRR